MSEYLLESSGGGSIANVAPNPCGTPVANQMLYVEALKQMYREHETVLGRAVFAAKCSLIKWYPDDDDYYGPAVLWTLFGDPALRMKIQRLTGIESRSVVGVTEPALYLAPNPARASVTVGSNAPDLSPARGVLSVCDVQGRVVVSSTGSVPMSLSVLGLQEGVYLCRFSADSATASRKLVVAR
jgi:hypothetical protein